MGDKYVTIKLPEDMIAIVDELVNSKLGFSSRTEVVKSALREYYEKQLEKGAISGNSVTVSKNDGNN